MAITQADTIQLLPTAEITAISIRQNNTGERQENWTTDQLRNYPAQHLGDLLAQESGAFIKSYGNGSLATVSLRGSGAGHTAVLWNGLPIQSPMLGLLDLALIPLNFVDQVGLQLGDNSAGWGSGAIGGVINLQNQWQRGHQWQLQADGLVGSFGLRHTQLSFNYNRKKWGSATRLFQQTADNDFSYEIREDLPLKTQTNAALFQRSLLQQFFFQPTTNQHFSFKFWTNQSEREIPPLTTQSRSEAVQTDDFLRFLVDWKMVQARTVWRAKLGWFIEQQNYQDPLININSNNDFQVGTAEVTLEHFFKSSTQNAAQQRLEIGAHHTYFAALADAYGQQRTQQRTALFANYRQQFQSFTWQVNLRQEMQDGQLIPFVPSVGIEKSINQHIIKAKIGRSYRLPTLNDLYWQPGGNPDLLPESGWSQELTWQNRQIRQKQWRYSTTVYNRAITNWVRWAFAAEAGYFRPQNLAQVWSRGVEQRVGWQRSINDWQFAINGGYDLTFSTNQIAIENPKIAAGAQLVYVPRQQAFGQLQIGFKNFNWVYQHSYTGEVATLSNTNLAAYQLSNTVVKYQFNRPRFGGQLFFRINNLYNKSYRVIERRAMPGRNFQLGVQIRLLPKEIFYMRCEVNLPFHPPLETKINVPRTKRVNQ
ncbi:MAG: TonB-dependent receptor plug domain-containing protein [Saprospiraceae bacterium]